MISRHADLAALSRAVADELAVIVPSAIKARGVAHLVLSGGSTPKRLFEELAQRGRGALPWDQIVLWFGDERTVPADHPDSNYRMAREALIQPLGLTRVHPIDGGAADPAAAAAAYEQQIYAELGELPTFDVVFLGLGPDGHTASLFPGTPALSVTDRICVANPVDSPVTKGKTTRITMTARVINAARHIRFLIAGADKAPTLAAVLEGPRQPAHLPAQLIRELECTWYVDTAAASQLTKI